MTSPSPEFGSCSIRRSIAARAEYDSTSTTIGFRPGRLRHRDAVFDLFLARRGDQHFDVVGRVGNRTQHLEVQADLVERERDVLVRLAFDLHLEFFLAQVAGQRYALRDDRRGRQRHRDVADLAAGAPPGALDGFGDDVDLVDVAVHDRAARQRLDRVALEPHHSLAGLGQLDDLDAGRANVEADQRRRLACKWQIECQGVTPYDRLSSCVRRSEKAPTTP